MAMTSFRFMLVLVPLPVWYNEMGNWRWYVGKSPTIVSTAVWMACIMSASSSPNAWLAVAQAFFNCAMDVSNRGENGCP